MLHDGLHVWKWSKMGAVRMARGYLVDAHLGEGSLQDLVVVHCIILRGSIEVHLQANMMLSGLHMPAPHRVTQLHGTRSNRCTRHSGCWS